MGIWGAGLYSGDFAMDLRSAAAAVARLPFDGDRLAELLVSLEPDAARNPGHEDHTTFWLVVADQFAKKGIACARVREKALEIIDRSSDLAMLSKLGMDAAGMGKRQTMLAGLRSVLSVPAQPGGPRRVLQKPQPLLLAVGDVLIYPTSSGKQINPYFKSKEQMVPEWRPDGWGAAMIVESGRAFDFLAWYRPLTIADALPQRPGLEQLRSAPLWTLQRAGTCSAAHFKKMELEKIATLPLRADKLESLFPVRPNGVSDAISDISIANRLTVGQHFRAAGRDRAITRLDELLA